MLNKIFVLCAGCQRSIFASNLAGVIVANKREEYYCDSLTCIIELSDKIEAMKKSRRKKP